MKKLFPAINFKEKMFFGNNYFTLDHGLFLRVFTHYFTKIFVHLSVIAAVCYFSICKYGGTQQIFTCSKSTAETRKKSELCPRLKLKE